MTKREIIRTLTRLLKEVRKLRKDVESINRRLNAAGKAAERIVSERNRGKA